MRICFPVLARSSFIEADIEVLRRFAEVDVVPYSRGRDVARAIARLYDCTHVFLWFASSRYLPLAIAARATHKPIAIVCGGYDVAADSDLSYGNMRPGWRRLAGRFLLAMADHVAAMSRFARDEAIHNAGVEPTSVSIIHLSVPTSPRPPHLIRRRRQVCTIAVTNMSSLRRKGIDRFASISRLLPDVDFVLGGPVTPDAATYIRRLGGGNLRLAGAMSDADRQNLLRTSAAYVQLSRHEAFGVAVAEAMLEECPPLLSRAGSLPEVGGDLAVYVDDGETDEGVATRLRRMIDRAREPNPALGDRIRATFSATRRANALAAMLATEKEWQ